MIRFALFLILALFIFGTPAEAAKVKITPITSIPLWKPTSDTPSLTLTVDPPHQVKLQAPLTIQIDDAESVELGPDCDLSLGLGNKAASNCTITIHKGKVIFDPVPPKR